MSLEICSNKIIKYDNELNYFLMFLVIIMIILQLIAWYKMMLFYRHLKFENIAILTGIIESIILLFGIYTHYEVLFEIGISLQIYIALYIIRRLIRTISQELYDNYNIYKIIYILLTILNTIFISLYLYTSFLKINTFKFILVSYTFFAFSISFLLFICGIKIEKMYKKLIEKINLYNEEFNNIRFKQLNYMIYTTFFSWIYQTYYILSKLYFNKDGYENKEIVIPNNKFTFCLHFIYLLSNFSIIIGNYISFYFVIKNQFYNKKNKKKNKKNDFGDSFLNETKNQKIQNSFLNSNKEDSLIDESSIDSIFQSQLK